MSRNSRSSQQPSASPASPSSPKTVQQPVSGKTWDAAIRWSELGLGLAITAFLAVCHFVLLRHMGALWRDEVQSVNLALSPTFADFRKDLTFDTFPVLWFALARCWSWVAGDSDSALRLLGLGVGLSIVAAVWWSTWCVNRGFPLLTLALFAPVPP